MFSSPGMWAAWRKILLRRHHSHRSKASRHRDKEWVLPWWLMNDTTVMLSERIRSEWPTTRDSRFCRARRTAFNSRVLIWSKASSFDQTPDTRWGWRTAPHPWPDASVVMTNDGGRAANSFPSRRREGEAHATHNTLISGLKGTSLSWESIKGVKYLRRWSWRGLISSLQLGTRSTKLARWPRNFCHKRTDAKGPLVRSWITSWRAKALCSEGRANNLGMSKWAPR